LERHIGEELLLERTVVGVVIKVQHYLPQLSAVNASASLNRIARLADRIVASSSEGAPTLLEESLLSELLLRVIGERLEGPAAPDGINVGCDARGLANTLWSVAVLAVPDSPLLKALA